MILPVTRNRRLQPDRHFEKRAGGNKRCPELVVAICPDEAAIGRSQ
jgi:hypothetical protein